MCSRFSQTKEEIRIRIRDMEILFGVVARYNVAPSQKVSVVVERAGKIQPEEMKWGWKPVWTKQLVDCKRQPFSKRSQCSR